jgi:hypothetical protein
MPAEVRKLRKSKKKPNKTKQTEKIPEPAHLLRIVEGAQMSQHHSKKE